MNPAHRDRLAFIRIVSGHFGRGMTVNHSRSGKPVKLSQPQQFLAQDRTIIEEAWPGDIVGLFDPGVFGIGDTLSVSRSSDFAFADFPIFPPERFCRVQPKDTMKRKQFLKGITQLTQEGAVQLFQQDDTLAESYVVGAVGQLQFEVLEYRLKNEYGCTILMHSLPYEHARWLDAGSQDVTTFKGIDRAMIVRDAKGRKVALFQSDWALRWSEDNNPKIGFLLSPPEL